MEEKYPPFTEDIFASKYYANGGTPTPLCENSATMIPKNVHQQGLWKVFLHQIGLKKKYQEELEMDFKVLKVVILDQK